MCASKYFRNHSFSLSFLNSTKVNTHVLDCLETCSGGSMKTEPTNAGQYRQAKVLFWRPTCVGKNSRQISYLLITPQSFDPFQRWQAAHLNQWNTQSLRTVLKWKAFESITLLIPCDYVSESRSALCQHGDFGAVCATKLHSNTTNTAEKNPT